MTIDLKECTDKTILNFVSDWEKRIQPIDEDLCLPSIKFKDCKDVTWLKEPELLLNISINFNDGCQPPIVE